MQFGFVLSGFVRYKAKIASKNLSETLKIVISKTPIFTRVWVIKTFNNYSGLIK